MPQQHTPIPWNIRQCRCNEVCSSYFIEPPHPTDSRFSEADARFIVQACNAYDDLVEVLASVENVIKECERLMVGLGPQVRAALAKHSSPQAR